MEKLLSSSHLVQTIPGDRSSSIQRQPLSLLLAKKGATLRVCLLGSTVVHSEPRKDQGAEVSLSQALEGRPPWQPSSAAPRMLLNKIEDFLSITQDSYFCYHVSCLPQPKEGKWFSICQLL